jgi:hypothetical protein
VISRRKRTESPSTPDSGRRAWGPARYGVMCALIVGLLAAPFAMAAGEGEPVRMGVRNPSSNLTQHINTETQIIANNDTYGTRQSNTRQGAGGGAIYGCRSATGNRPCVRANNLNNGRAFEFETRSGNEGGFIKVGQANPNPNAVPFNTNAGGRVANLNADKVDGLDAEEIVQQARANVLRGTVTSAGVVQRESGVTGAGKLGTGDYEVTFGRDVSGCTYQATIGSATATPAPSGEVGAARREGNANAVRVTTFTSDGTPADRTFELTVNC